MPRAAELTRLLENGPFPAALRAAIDASGLSLGRVRHRLVLRGVTVSVPTLSLWQSGRRRPERPESLRALRHLEHVLDLPAGSLGALLGPPKPRGRTADSAGQVSLYDHVRVSREGVVAHSRLVLRGPAARWSARWSLATDAAPTIRVVRGGRVGRVEHDLDDGRLTAELVLTTPVTADSSAVIEYEAAFAPAQSDHVRLLDRPIRDYQVEVDFTDPPAECVRVDDGRPLLPDQDGAVHIVLADAVGRVGVRWHG
ncbi:hypothetical protein GCM10022243_09510 [Saccharothrix violaceirubra]|uniref:Transcriptional regulator with XRE-family HTH domain n=1 Tax=Saccharothrix violaceirubra TaxID=413306 RepID=A0A7W7WWK6_9PSEU|nr:hypothetical protein [Saccharothrix violaceirubra]MBB4966211.1 transcriptional regulator with XRE-family HTH domain [Saccharothrix violaceirubra]